MALDRQSLKQGLKDPRQAFVGQEFNRYEILSVIGRGGAGAVFRARHRELGSLVALKLLMAEDPTPEAVARFQREGRVLAQLKHENVVGISDLGEDSGIPFLAMELVEGDNLHQLVRGKGGHPLEFGEAVEITLAIARALKHCHDAGAFHRDVKPNNILVEHGTRRPVLTDFGLVKSDPTKLGQGDAAKGITMAGELIGTPSFMAPEQFDPGGQFGDVGPKTDIWGLGATLFFVLTGEPPFAAKNVVDLYTSVTTERVRNPRLLRATTPEALDELTMACLTKNVEQRIGVDELIARLEALQGGMARKDKRRGVKHASIVLLVFVGLVVLELTVLHPQRGRALLQRLGLGQIAAGADSEQVRALEADVKQGKPGAMIKLGVLLHRGGEGVPQDDARALALFQRAADEKQNPQGMMWLAYFHEHGYGLDGPDLEGALRYYEQAAASGDDTVADKSAKKAAELKAKLGR